MHALNLHRIYQYYLVIRNAAIALKQEKNKFFISRLTCGMLSPSSAHFHITDELHIVHTVGGLALFHENTFLMGFLDNLQVFCFCFCGFFFLLCFIYFLFYFYLYLSQKHRVWKGPLSAWSPTPCYSRFYTVGCTGKHLCGSWLCPWKLLSP